MKTLIISIALSATAILHTGTAVAAIMTQIFDDNDCAGYFNPTGTSGFDACSIFVDADGQEIVLSPVIAKYDVEADSYQVSQSFSTITGNEFTITETATGTGHWSYTPGAGDPGIRFWVAKGGKHGFHLFWQVDDAIVEDVCDINNPYTLSCLAAAEFVSAGDYATPFNKGTHAALSHITFYDSEDPYIVPVPAAVWLMASGLIGLAMVARRRAS